LLPRPPTPTPFPYTTLFRSPPAFPVEEAPEEELSGARIEPVDATPGDADRDNARRRLRDLGDVEPEAKRLQDGHDDAKADDGRQDRKSTRLNSSHLVISYAV